MGMSKKSLFWVFDYVSPFAYLQFHRLASFCQQKDIELVFKPVLFAGLLKHWGQLGPAEVQPKRIYTYRHTAWLAAKRGLTMRFPAAHPFNPLPLLRLTIALENQPPVIEDLFNLVWRDGQLPSKTNLGHIAKKYSDQALDELISQTRIKKALADNGHQAIQWGVFGVPGFVLDDEIFWGDDCLAMLSDYLDNPDLFKSPEMLRLSNLPNTIPGLSLK